MNEYTANLERVEFIVTLACTGRCRHCSQGEHSGSAHIDAGAAARAVLDIAQCRSITSVMTFGGEPMLYPQAVYAVHSAARDAGIPKRQLITNGFFSRNIDTIAAAARSLDEAGVNDILLSADAFHQESIPLEPVKQFALQIKRRGIGLRVHPAWLESPEADNPYNSRTREILAVFEALGIPQSGGNVIFPSGNALKYLGEYFAPGGEYTDPYAEDPVDIRAVCIEPNGDVLGGNIYSSGIVSIIETYQPQEG